MLSEKFDREAFVASASRFRENLASEEALVKLAAKAMSALGDAVVQLVALSREVSGQKGPLLTASIDEASVHICGGNRNIMLAPAQGSGLDTRLRAPRGRQCSQVLVFCHLTGQDQTTLLSSFRIYEDGQCTDGEHAWSMDSGGQAFLPYLARLIESTIFSEEIFWPELSQLPEYLQKIPILEQEIHDAPLKKPCVGFECALGGGGQ